ncbi:MAG: extracellular solute-binding protein [Phycisphaerales bacterium]
MTKHAAALLGLVSLALLASCGRDDASGGGAKEVVLYSSVDDVLLREVVAVYEKETGVRVLVVGDTEATKTTGLVQRLIAEKGNPRADVWWSSEPFGSILLSKEGVLAPYTSQSAESHFEDGWPKELRGSKGDWYAFAQRARVIAYSEERVETPPRTLAQLGEPEWTGRIGMARPEFGTTRGQMGALLDAWGEKAYDVWLLGLEYRKVRLYDGNSAVVRAIAQGEIDVGLTDTDDVWAAQRQGWRVALAYESIDPDAGQGRLPSLGAMVVPNTVALVAGGPHPDQGKALIDFLLSPRVESLIAASDSGNMPVIPGVASDPAHEIENPWRPDLEKVAGSVAEAVERFEQRVE